MKSLRQILVFLLVTGAVSLLPGQPVVAPTPDRPGETTRAGAYTVSNSFEVGYRLSDVSGNRDVYRSSVNFGNGIRLLEGQLRINSTDGRGRWFDEFAFRTLGAGQDPYQASTLRLEKNSLYRYDMQFRVVNYFNRLPSLWLGEHGVNSERIFQNHDLTLFPGSRVEVLLGYDRYNHNGPGFSSEGIPDQAGAFDSSRFLRLATNLRQVNNQYRAGVSFRVSGVAVTVMQALDNYREDSSYADASNLPSQAANVQPVDSLQRAEPIHGNTPVTTIAIRTEKERTVGFQGRFAYASGNRDSILSENIVAVNPAAALSTLRQTFVLGHAGRKQGSGDFTLTLLPSLKWTITNTTAVNNTRINGDSAFVEASVFTNEVATFKHLGIRHVSNATEVNFRPVQTLGLYGAYRFSTRRLRTETAFLFPQNEFRQPLFEQQNEIHSGVGGFRWLPVSGLRLSFDAEVGRADRPLTPRSERSFHAETARLQWRRNGFVFSVNFQNAINRNPVSLVDHRSESRQFGAHLSWLTPDGRWTLDAGYSRLELDTATGIASLLDPDGSAGLHRSFYVSNLNVVNFGSRLQVVPRLTLFLGYHLAKDTGDGGGPPTFPSAFNPSYPSFRVENANIFNSFPLSYQSPLARLSVELRESFSWNLGWQFYHYGEEFTGQQNYHAHVAYSSFRWSF